MSLTNKILMKQISDILIDELDNIRNEIEDLELEIEALSEMGRNNEIHDLLDRELLRKKLVYKRKRLEKLEEMRWQKRRNIIKLGW